MDYKKIVTIILKTLQTSYQLCCTLPKTYYAVIVSERPCYNKYFMENVRTKHDKEVLHKATEELKNERVSSVKVIFDNGKEVTLCI